MSETLLRFGQPWHGKLRPGQIELQPGTPVSSVSFDGITAAVQPVDGNLGHTRYHKAPGLPVPPVDAALAAAHGALTEDFILYSEKWRYSPVSSAALLINENEWLLYDGTAGRWRKMAIGFTFNNAISKTWGSPSPAGTTVASIYVYRKPEVVSIDHLQGAAAPAQPAMTLIGTRDLPLIYAYSPLHRPTAYPYKPDNVLLTIDPSPDGRKILVRLEAQRWDGFEISPWNNNAPHQVYDDSQAWLFGVWEFTLADDGTTLSAPVGIWPARSAPVQPDWIDVTLTQTGGAVWDDFGESSQYPGTRRVDYYLPMSLHEVGKRPGYETSILINAAYDKNGSVKLTYFHQAADISYDSTLTFQAYLGVHYIPLADDPADHIPTVSFSSAAIHYVNGVATIGGSPVSYTQYNIRAAYPGYTTMRNQAVTGGLTYGHQLAVGQDSTILKTWPTKFTGPLKWRWKTNNVAELYVGSESKLRVGPGVIDDSAVSVNGYATWNPRTSQLLSSETPVGWV